MTVAQTTQHDGLHINRGVPDVQGYYPLNEPKIGTAEFPEVFIVERLEDVSSDSDDERS